MLNLFLDATIICASLVALIKGSEWIMRGAVAIAEKIGVSKLVIASTLIAFGTGLSFCFTKSM